MTYLFSAHVPSEARYLINDFFLTKFIKYEIIANCYIEEEKSFNKI